MIPIESTNQSKGIRESPRRAIHEALSWYFLQ